MDCIFCKIVAGEIPCHKIYEDENYLAFLDIRPLNPGHTLVVPKKHYRWVWDLPAGRQAAPNIGDYYDVVGRVAKAIRRVLRTDWVASAVFGEEVPHAHVWLVPRFPDDGHGGALDLANIKAIGREEMARLADLIRAAVQEP